MPLAMMVNDSIQDLTSLDKPHVAVAPKVTKPEEANPQQPPSFRYAGQFEYSEDYYFHPYSLTPTTGTATKESPKHADTDGDHHIILSSQRRSRPGGLIGCLFPWLFGHAQGEDGWHNDEFEDDDAGNKSDDGSASNNSNMLGEKLSQRERQAVLNRLRLPADAKLETRKNLLNGIPVAATSPLEILPRGPLQGILKRADSIHPPSTTTNSPPSPTKTAATDNSNRRSLFPTTYEKNTNKAVSFAPMARVITVKSKNDMDAEEKSNIWWQRSDYEEFRRTGRIITKSNNAGLLSKEEAAPPESPPVHQKWWHSFGHSRRGLEHVVSIDEGRQRQQNVKAAIQAVLKEQSRSTTDSEKLRAVALNYTAWARDLALAAGASDADAVVRGFGEDRKSREFFLLKQQKRKTHMIVPDFMQPRTKTTLQQRLLDANISRRKRPSVSTTTNVTPKEDETPIDVHDSMAQKAAGFAADGKKHDMAAVLAGTATAVN